MPETKCAFFYFHFFFFLPRPFSLLPKCPIPRGRNRKCAHGQSAHAPPPFAHNAPFYLPALFFPQHNTL